MIIDNTTTFSLFWIAADGTPHHPLMTPQLRVPGSRVVIHSWSRFEMQDMPLRIGIPNDRKRPYTTKDRRPPSRYLSLSFDQQVSNSNCNFCVATTRQDIQPHKSSIPCSTESHNNLRILFQSMPMNVLRFCEPTTAKETNRLSS